MPLRRVQAIEFNDQAWVPAVLRDTIVESLSRTLLWGKILEGLAEPFVRFLDEAKTRSVLDLGSGGGGPADALSSALERRGCAVDWTLTDLFPRVAVWESLRTRHESTIAYVPDPVDATAIPTELSRGRARTIINVLHHFPEPLARGVLADAIDKRAPIFVAEGFERTPLGFLPFAPFGIPALAASPFYAADHRLERFLLTWATPVALAVSIWDGLVSTMRVYTEEELLAMAGTGSGYRWTYGNYHWVPFGKGYYFYGIPSEQRKEQ